MSLGRKSKRLLTAGAAAAVAVLVGMTAAGPASAADTQGTNWWYGAYHVADAQAAGWTGKGVKIAVIDNQIDPSLPVFAGAHLTVNPTSICTNARAVTTTNPTGAFHGSTVTSLIVGNGTGVGAVKGIAPGADVTFYGWGGGATCTTPSGQDPFAIAFKEALDGGARIISTSLAYSSLSSAAAQQVARAVASGVIVVAAVPDSAMQEISGRAPTAYNATVNVAAIDASGDLQADKDTGKANVEPNTTVVAAGVGLAYPGMPNGASAVGSSFAAPLVAGMLADVWQKYPKATGNQLVQSLIHNTSSTDNPDGYGYGYASLTKMLPVDPTRYPNVNPLMNHTGGEPTQKQIDVLAGTASAATHSAASRADGQTGRVSSDGGVGIAVVVGVVIVLVIAGGILLAVMLTRRTRAGRGEGST